MRIKIYSIDINMPFVYKRKGKRSGKKSKPRASKAKAAPKTKQAQVALIKQVIAREDETKFRSELLVNKVPFNSQITLASDIIRLLPKIVQGQPNTGNSIYERTGRKISVRNFTVNAEFCLTDVDRSSALVVCYWILTHKEIKQQNGLAAMNLGGLIMTGDDNNVQNFNGYVQDAMLPINNTKFTVLKSGRFQLGKNTGTVQDSTTGGNQPLAGQAVRHAISVKMNCPKTWTYEQDENTPRTVFYPSGYAPFMLFGYYHQNQTSPDGGFQDVTLTLRSNVYYDDA